MGVFRYHAGWVFVQNTISRSYTSYISSVLCWCVTSEIRIHHKLIILLTCWWFLSCIYLGKRKRGWVSRTLTNLERRVYPNIYKLWIKTWWLVVEKNNNISPSVKWICDRDGDWMIKKYWWMVWESNDVGTCKVPTVWDEKLYSV